MIRKATFADIPAIICLGQEALAAGDTPDEKVEAAVMRPNLQMMMRSPQYYVLVLEEEGSVEGFIIGSMQDLWYRKARYVTDMGFYVRPGFSGKAVWLFARFMRWAKKMPGVEHVSVAAANGQRFDERLQRVYARFGLVRMGSVYFARVAT